jgi:hypothetical protein
MQNDILKSPSVSKLIKILGLLLAVLLVFWAGTVVGSREAGFSRDWQNNYLDQFGGPGSPLVPNSDRDDSFASAHGAFGEIVGVRLPVIIVKGPAESEKTVTVSGSTAIRRFRSMATTTDLVPGETVVVIGEPDSMGDIQASLIRIVPAMPPNGAPPAENAETPPGIPQ